MKSKEGTQSLLDYLNNLPKRSPLDILLPDSQYYSQLEKAQMAKAWPVETPEEANGRESE